MGCGASAKPAVVQGDGTRYGVLVRGAKGLREADVLTGKSDPYCVVRFGPAGSSWADKDEALQRRSATAPDTTDPHWQFAFSVNLPKTAEDWEVHLRVFDSDTFGNDDGLGEVVVKMSVLREHPDGARDYALTGSGALSGSTVELMAGTRVEKALMEALQNAMHKEKESVFFPLTRSALNHLASYWNMAPTYHLNLAMMLQVWQSQITKDSDPSSDWFNNRTTNAKGEQTYTWEGPEDANSVMFTGHEDCSRRLAELGRRLGVSDRDGEAYKPGWLGVNKVNSMVWPEVPWHTIGLGAPQEAHAKIRPLITKLLGPSGRWSNEWLAAQAQAFFRGRGRIAVNKDLRTWVTQVLHKVLVGMDLTEREGEEFMEMQMKILIVAGLPDVVADSDVVLGILDAKATLAKKQEWLLKYKNMLPKVLPECATMSPDELTAMVSAVMDALLFAGGQSVPTVLSFALAIPYSEFGAHCLPADFDICDVSRLPSYIFEVIRRFPPVSGFVFAERSYGSDPDRRVYLNLQMAQRDARVWGPTAGEFKLRPITDYHRNSVGFAEPAISPGIGDPNARSCPARNLALAMCFAFMREFARSIPACAERTPGVHRVAWVARAEQADSEGSLAALAPSEITLNMNGTTSFILFKNQNAEWLEPEVQQRSGAELLRDLTPNEVTDLRTQVGYGKFENVNAHTKVLIQWVRAVAAKSDRAAAAAVPPPVEAQITEDDIWTGPFPGMRMVKTNDAPRSLLRNLKTLVESAGLVALDAIKELPLNEDLNELVYFGSVLESSVAMDNVFGRYLPQQYSTWDGLDTDHGTADMCMSGIGSWYLRGARSAAESDHEVPEGAVFECCLDYMSKYETRGQWIGYGHTAYFGAAPAEGGAPKLLGIWACENGGKLTRPGEHHWEAAKAGFRCSLGTSVTLKDHLTWSHWIYANYLQNAARETLSANHPVRRLLRQFYYNTAAINFNAKEVLFPVNHFGWRVFGFTETSWGEYFSDIWASFSWKPFPELLKGRNLPEEFEKSWPLKVDGEALFERFAGYARGYLKLFYEDDMALIRDTELVEFWAHFDRHLKWNLPHLSMDSLVTLIADLMWWVTAGHEYHGAIVEYLTLVNGLSPKLAPGSAVSDAQSFAQALCLIALTGIRMPKLMEDWTHLFTVDSWSATTQQAVLDVVRNLQEELAKLGHEIDERNVQRERKGQKPFVACHPRILETSVSI